MAYSDSSTPHNREIARLRDDGWQTRGFNSFVFLLHFCRRLIEYAPRPMTVPEQADMLFSEMSKRTFTARDRLAPSICRIVAKTGREMTTPEVVARMRRYRGMDVPRLSLVPDAWRVSRENGESILDIVEVSDTHPLFKDRLYHYSRFDDEIRDLGRISIRLVELNARSGAEAEHRLPDMLIDACVYARDEAH